MSSVTYLPAAPFVCNPQGNRDVIDALPPGSQRVMGEVLRLVDAYDLYGGWCTAVLFFFL